AEEVRRPFDLARGPLLRTRLIRVAGDDHVLVLMMHHIITDGWSGGIITGELAALYAAAARGEPADLCAAADLPPLPIQYADFAAWQRGQLSGEVLTGQLDHWRDQLDGVPALHLPTDRPRPPVRTDHGAVLD